MARMCLEILNILRGFSDGFKRDTRGTRSPPKPLWGVSVPPETLGSLKTFISEHFGLRILSLYMQSRDGLLAQNEHFVEGMNILCSEMKVLGPPKVSGGTDTPHSGYGGLLVPLVFLLKSSENPLRIIKISRHMRVISYSRTSRNNRFLTKIFIFPFLITV